MSTLLYARVSTADQTLDHQRTQAEAAGFHLDHVIADHGVSGVGTLLRDRPQGKRLYDMLRAGDTLVVRWLDRLGRNYQDVTEVLREFLGRGVIVRTIISSLTFDGAIKDPMQRAVRDALIGFMAAMAEAEAEARKEAQRAGIAHARSRITAYRGRKPSYTREQVEKVRDLLAQGTSVSAIRAATGLSRQTIYRIKEDPPGIESALAAWQSTR